jgi:hypothetical protein
MENKSFEKELQKDETNVSILMQTKQKCEHRLKVKEKAKLKLIVYNKNKKKPLYDLKKKKERKKERRKEREK